jgi:hypothetical protein
MEGMQEQDYIIVTILEKGYPHTVAMPFHKDKEIPPRLVEAIASAMQAAIEKRS